MATDSGRAGAAIGVVAIGRNEGGRLAECLASIRGASHVVYVDSGSTDGSADLARGLGVEVVELAPDSRFTAGRARNAGFERLLAVVPSLEYVMFLDGDCTLADGWLGAAVAALDADPGVAVVCGRRRERECGRGRGLRPGRTLYRRLMDIEWDTPVGEATSCGGDAAVRVRPFRESGGFDPSLPAGEEPEWCHRLRAVGWRIVRVAADMTCHDMGETTPGSWWRRHIRHGYTALDLVRRFPGPAGPYRRQVLGAWAWGVAVPAGILFAAWYGPSLSGSTALMYGLLAVLIYPVQALRIAWSVRSRVPDLPTALAHGVGLLVAKWAHLLGQFAYLADTAAGRAPRHIEYRASRSRGRS